MPFQFFFEKYLPLSKWLKKRNLLATVEKSILFAAILMKTYFHNLWFGFVFRVFFQVVECCQFFNTKYGSNPNVPLVTLLSGQKNCSVIGANDEAIKGFSPMGIAKTAGINLEYIETFHAKWKTSSKSHG